MTFVIHANLDQEARWAGGSLPGKVATRVSYYAALTAALGPRDTDIEVWAPAAVDASRIHMPHVTMKVGTPPRADLVWARAEAKAANDRRRLVALGLGVPGARVVSSIDEVGGDGPWIVKAPWTTAGRDRCRGEGAPTEEQRTRIARLLALHGELVREPWLPRAFDVGVCVHQGEVMRPHGLVVDAHGTFAGIIRASQLDAAHADDLRARARAICAALAIDGPAAIDAFVTTDRDLVVCEVNARYTFGWVACALGEDIGFGAPPRGASVLIADTGDGVTAWASSPA